MKRSAVSRLRGSEPVLEELQYLVAGGDGRLTGFIDQMRGHDTVGRGNELLEEWRKIGVRRAVG